MRVMGLIVYELLMLLLSPIFWLVVAVIGFQCYRVAKVKREFFHTPRERIVKKALLSVLFGLLGGLLGSILLVVLGISVLEIGLEYLWVVAIVLLLFHQRLMCFAYAGGIVALVSFCCGWPEVNIPQLLALVAVLHLVEAFLIWVSGDLQATPLYVMGRQGRLVGGFMMQNFWPLPLVALALSVLPMGMGGSGEVIAMPQWWPILPSEGVRSGPFWGVVYVLTPVLAALGYSDLALTMTPRAKSRRSAVQLLGYSVVLLLLAVLAVRWAWLLPVAIVFAPLGHELLIRWGQRREMAGAYLYQDTGQGAMVLDTLKGFAAEQMGVQRGDRIVAVNGVAIASVAQMRPWLANRAEVAVLEVVREGRRFSVKPNVCGEDLGVILVPEADGLRYLDFAQAGGVLLKLAQKFWARRKRKI